MLDRRRSSLRTGSPLLDQVLLDAPAEVCHGLEVPTGDYQVCVTLANTLTVAIDTGTLTLASGKVYTALARDPAPMSSAFGAILLTDRE